MTQLVQQQPSGSRPLAASPRPNHGPVASGTVSPNVLVRLSAHPVTAVTEMSGGALRNALRAAGARAKALESRRAGVSSELFQVIGDEGHAPIRRDCLALRRHVHNGRARAGEVFARVRGLLPVEAVERVEEYLAAERDMRRAAEDVERAYLADLVHARQSLARTSTTPWFSQGIALASRSLASALGRSDWKLSGTAEITGVERSLVRYLSRASLKATPFGAFCVVVAGRRVGAPAEEGGGLEIRGDLAVLQESFRLNKRLLGVAVGHALASEALRRTTPLSVNPTLRDVGDDLKFLAARGGSEAFNLMPSSPQIRLVIELASRDRGSSLAELAARLGDQTGASQDVAVAYLTGLVEAGLLIPDLPFVDRSADWVRDAIRFLGSALDEDARRFAELLRRLESMRQELQPSPAAERERLVAAMRRDLTGVLEGLGINAAMDAKVLVRHDVSSSATALLSEDHRRTRALSALTEWVGITRRLAHPRTDRLSALSFFKSTWPDRDRLPLLEFYETYYRGHYKELRRLRREQSEKSNAGRKLTNPLEVPAVDAVFDAGERARALISARWAEHPHAEELRIGAEELRAIASVVPEIPGVASVGVLAQFFEDSSGRVRIVTPRGSYTAGYGKMFSRFLHLLPEGVLASLQSENRGLGAEELAVLGGDGFFNGNLHPRLTDAEVVYPGATSGDARTHHQVADLEVVLVEDGADLALQRADTRQTVLPVDLGFLNPEMRPPLFQLMSVFTPPAYFGLWMPESYPGSPDGEQPDVVYRPRVVFDDSLVLSRRTWIAPGHLMPDFRGGTPAQNLSAVWQWREQHGIPDRVFMRMRAAGGRKGRGAPKQPEQVDWHKPQYVDFLNPYLVDQFVRTPHDAQSFVVLLEECYPGDGERLRIDGVEHASELLLQINFGAAA